MQSMIYRVPVTVSARSAKDLPVAANVESDAPGLGVVDMRAGSPVRAGTFPYDGGDLVADWLAHEAPLCLPTSNAPVIRAVMDYTNAHLADVTVAAACADVGISERSLRRQFGAATGMTWRQYVLQSRLLRAMALLTEPGR